MVKVHGELYSVPFLFPMKRNFGLENETLCKVSVLDGEGTGTPLQYSCLENPMDRETWWATVHDCKESDTTERLHNNNTILSQEIRKISNKQPNLNT